MSLPKKKIGLEFESMIKPFLKNPEKENLNRDQFLKSPVTILKDCRDDVAEKMLKIYGITTLNDLAIWVRTQTNEQLDAIVTAMGLSETIFETWVIIAIMALNIKEMKRADSIYSKSLFAGISKAGKTSLIQHFIFGQKTEDVLNFTPTLGVDKHIINYPDGALMVWELGGQVKFRDLYLKSPDKYFLSIQSLVFVIDIQDSSSFAESSKYLVQILYTLNSLKIKCPIIILLHKCDPDFMQKKEFLENAIKIQELIKPEVIKRDFQCIFRFTSVYYSIEKLRKSLSEFIDIQLISKVLVDATDSANQDQQKTLIPKIKEFFHQLSNSSEQESKKEPEPRKIDEKTLVRVEMENKFHMVSSEAFQSLISDRSYDILSPIMEDLIKLWRLWRL